MYLAASVWVEMKKFRHAWPPPYAHAMRDEDPRRVALPAALGEELAQLRTGLETSRKRGETLHGTDQRRQGPYGAVSASEMAPTAGSLPIRDGRARFRPGMREGRGTLRLEHDDKRVEYYEGSHVVAPDALKSRWLSSLQQR